MHRYLDYYSGREQALKYKKRRGQQKRTGKSETSLRSIRNLYQQREVIMEYYSAYYDSPVGRIMLGAGANGLVGLWIEGQKYFGDTVDGYFAEKPDLPIFNTVRKWLDAYFAGKKPPLSDLTLTPAGGEFRQGVWKILCGIPLGQVLTYGQIAKKMAERMNRKSMSSQAVGGAVGHNPISIIIPCHRVVGSGGSLTGYAGGISTKIKLLELEGVDVSRFSVPKKGTAL